MSIPQNPLINGPLRGRVKTFSIVFDAERKLKENPMTIIDLRSDTVTRPTPAMREAMFNAPVGDDVYGEDPTINTLEAEAAERLGKEAGLFVASGSMGNLTAVLTHCGRGDEMIVGRDAHISKYEVGSAASFGGVPSYQLDLRPDGTYDLDAIRKGMRVPNVHFPTTKLICLENTHGGAIGAPVPVSYMQAVREIADEHNVKIHVDGARFFNAATALNVSPAALAADADSVTFCLSKGLCAPVGSVLVGSRDFIERARRVRKSLGGGMRQAGILAAAGLISLREMTLRLGEDHANARFFAEGLAAMPYTVVDLDRVKTNMVFFALTEDAPVQTEELSARLKEQYNILMRPYDVRSRSFRVVTHNDVSREALGNVLNAMRELFGLPVSERLTE